MERTQVVESTATWSSFVSPFDPNGKTRTIVVTGATLVTSALLVVTMFAIRNNKLLVTGATLLVTSALLVVTMFAIRNNKLLVTGATLLGTSALLVVTGASLLITSATLRSGHRSCTARPA